MVRKADPYPLWPRERALAVAQNVVAALAPHSGWAREPKDREKGW